MNTIIECIDSGHMSSLLGALPRCKMCSEVWPCPAMVEAREKNRQAAKEWRRDGGWRTEKRP